MSNRFLITFVIFACPTLIFWGFVPINNYIHGLPLTLPIPAWYVAKFRYFIKSKLNLNCRFPYADTYLSLFWVAYIYQTFGALFNANLILILCSFEFTCFCFLNASIQALSSRLMKIGNTTTKTVPSGPKRRSQAYENIVDLVKQHLLLKR